MSQQVVDVMQQRFGDAIISSHSFRGDEVVFVQPDRITEILTALKNDKAFDMNLLMGLTCMDRGPGQSPRFDVIYLLYSLTHKHRLRIKVSLSETDLTLPSAIQLWRSADWYEREVWDMFGIRFEGHPNLKRLLMFEEFEGHPLRRDYQIDKRQDIPTPLLLKDQLDNYKQLND